ncbi:MAG: response regulator [Betaproteobacteria bacterium]|nr:response regulator [Betaproteobacteria bacterium]
MATFFNSLSVLLVEPSRVQERLIEQMLRDAGVVRIAVARNGEEALLQIRTISPNCIVSALYLPDMNGTDLVCALRAGEDPDIPFILISSETRPQMLDPIRQSGACIILPKPFNEQQLERALRGVLDYLEPGEPISANIDLENLKVLLVDDSPNARKFIRRVLKNLGIENCVEAKDGTEAVAILGETMFDLVLTDYNMPEMDGKALTQYIRTQSWQASVPILMITSEQDGSRLAAIEQAGVSAICDKPFNPNTVRQLIEQMLSS